MKKTIGKWFLQAGVIVFLLSFLPPISANAGVLSAHGKEAIQQISTCINSEGKDTLNVLYLVDESGSLERTDPSALRVGGLQASLEQFRNISVDRPYFKVNREIATFGDSYHRPKEWQVLNDGQLNSDISWIGQTIPKLTNGKYTDWKLALTEAYKDFQQKLSPTSCNIMVWFTDGAIDVNGSEAKTKEALAQICSADPVTGKSTPGQAIIDQFRNSNINKETFKKLTVATALTDQNGKDFFF